MCEVEFRYKGGITIIQCNENDLMSDICKKFVNKALVDKNNIYFTYNGKGGNDFNEKETFNQMSTSMDKAKKKMVILVNDINKDNETNNNGLILQSKVVICPKCKERIKMNIKNYKVNLFDCKNEHKYNNLSLKEYEDTQKLDLSKIICGDCKENNKGNSFNNEFFKCFDCGINLCVLCSNKHDQSHNIINYDKIFYICSEHNDFYTSYCKNCKYNLCMLCEDVHQKHDRIYFGKIMSNKRELHAKLYNLKLYIDKFNDDYNEMIGILNEVKNNFNLYYKIKKDIINNYDNKERYYELLISLKEISNNNDIINDITQISNQNNILNKFNYILNIYNNMKAFNQGKKDILGELNQKIIDFEKENKKLKDEISSLQTINSQKLILEKENKKLKDEILNLKLLNTQKITLFEKEKKLLNDEISRLQKLDAQKITSFEEENKKLNEEISRLQSLNTQMEDNNNEKLSLIKQIIEAGIDEDTKLSEYSMENKCLISGLILSDYIKSEKVANVMLEVDRGDFAPENFYADCPQYIGYNVTISAPHMHAFALEYLSDYCDEEANILDVGSGSGFLTVALSKMTNDTGRVIGIEHIPELYNFGINNVKKNHSDLLDGENIIFVKGDGRKGCKEYGPYNAIHVGAASEKIPQDLLDQLANGGRMFIPVGKRGETQNIYLVDKDLKGKITYNSILSVCYGMLTDKDTQLKDD